MRFIFILTGLILTCSCYALYDVLLQYAISYGISKWVNILLLILFLGTAFSTGLAFAFGEKKLKYLLNAWIFIFVVYLILFQL